MKLGRIDALIIRYYIFLRYNQRLQKGIKREHLMVFYLMIINLKYMR